VGWVGSHKMDPWTTLLIGNLDWSISEHVEPELINSYAVHNG